MQQHSRSPGVAEQFRSASLHVHTGWLARWKHHGRPPTLVGRQQHPEASQELSVEPMSPQSMRAASGTLSQYCHVEAFSALWEAVESRSGSGR